MTTTSKKQGGSTIGAPRHTRLKREARNLHVEQNTKSVALGDVRMNQALSSLTVVFAKDCISDDGVVFLPCENKHLRRAAAEVALVQVQPSLAENDRLVMQGAIKERGKKIEQK